MKKFLVVLVFLLVLFSSVFCVQAVQAETISDEILGQAKTQADLFLELKNALGLEWLDEYNAYLQDPSVNPAPTWETSVNSLINKNYLSATFPTGFTITVVGSEAKISRDITNQAIRDAISIYIPAITTVGDTVSLLVQRPAQWVAYEAALNGKVDRDGSGNPDILPGASLDFGAGASINFLSNDGKLLGINSLVYKGEEADTRFVNAAGDNMTGQLTINGNKVWHAGNDGAGSGLDADLLDGKDSSFFTNAGNLSSGIVPVARLSGTYNINISGNAATATKLAAARTISLTGNASGSASFDGSGNISINTSVSYASNADAVDGKHASAFASASHGHGEYVQKAGDTATGPIYFRGGLSAEAQSKDDITTRTPSGFWQTNSATTGEGWPQTTNTWYHLLSSTHSNTGNYYAMQFAGNFYNSNDIYYRSTNGSGTTPWNKMWHSGNDGSGSGMDADMLDGAHLSEILGGLTLKKVITYSNPGTYTFNKSSAGSKVYRIIVKCWGGGGGGGGGCHGRSVKQPVSWMAGGNGGASKFGSYMTANGGYGGQGATRYGGGSPGAGGTASGGEENLTGGAGEKGADDSYGGKGGNSPNGGSGGVRNSGNGYAPGGGGGGGAASGNGGGGNGGGGGGYCKRTFSLDSLPDSIQVVVGGGGRGGSPDGGGRGGSGAPGRVVIECWGL